MTINEVISSVDASRPNRFDNQFKLTLINKLEVMIQTEIQHVAKDNLIVYKLPMDADVVLIVGQPYSDLYKQYLCAMIDLENAEYENYQNGFELFNSTYGEYSAFYLRGNTPAVNNSIKNFW